MKNLAKVRTPRRSPYREHLEANRTLYPCLYWSSFIAAVESLSLSAHEGLGDMQDRQEYELSGLRYVHHGGRTSRRT